MRTERPFNPNPNIVDQLEQRVHAPWPEQFRQHDDGSVVRATMPYPYMLGDRTLPVARFAGQVLDTVIENVASVMRSPTGSGKTTNMPLFWLQDESIEHIIVTQPRVIAARETAERMATVLTASGLDGSKLVGYDTANEGNATVHNRVIVTTHGLTWQQLMHGKYGNGKKLLIMSDEFHERDAHQDPLLEACATNGLRTVVASATIDVQRIADYLSRASGNRVPILDLPGSPYRVDERDLGQPLSKAIITYARQGRHDGIEHDVIMAVVPTRKDIYATISRIARFLPIGMRAIPVHGDMTPDEQALCFKDYPNGKVVIGTSILQTSITIPRVRVVLDTALTRTGNWEDGVKSVPLRPATLSERIQRKGRTGRTRDGIYEIVAMENYPELPRNKDGSIATPEFDTPQIQRTDPTSIYLRYLEQGRDLRDVNLPDPVGIESIEQIKQYLVVIGAITVQGNRATGNEVVRLTTLGREMNKLTIDPPYAAMIIEARKISPQLGLQMMAACAACQVQTIVDNDQSRQGLWRRLIPNENHSDIVAQLQLMVHGLGMTPEERRVSGYIEGRFMKAQRVLERLATQAGFEDFRELHLPTDDEREQLRGCIISAVPEIFIRTGTNRFRGRRGVSRQLSDTSVLGGEWERLIVGLPFDLNHLRKNGPSVKNLVVHGTAVTVHELIHHAPHRVTLTPETLMLDEAGTVCQRNVVYFDGSNTKQFVNVSIKPNTDTAEYLASALVGFHSAGYRTKRAMELYATLERLQDLQNRTSVQLHVRRAYEIIRSAVLANASTVTTIEEAASVVDLRTINALVSSEQRSDIYANSPEAVTFVADGVDCIGTVTYLKNVATIQLPAQATFRLPESFPELGNRQIYVKFGNAKAQTLQDAQQSQTAHYEKAHKESIVVAGSAPIDDSAIDPQRASEYTARILKQQGASDKRPRRRWGGDAS